MKKENLYISTTAQDAVSVAKNTGLGIELAEFCTAANMDEHFSEVEEQVAAARGAGKRFVVHGPFNELFPCAIDPLAVKLADYRYRQSLELAQSYGAEKLVLHGGFQPYMYYPCWYQEQSVRFWKQFVHTVPDHMTLCLENVLEPVPEYLLEIVTSVNDPRLKLCVDLGHCNVYSTVPPETWIRCCAPHISHFHIHNNYREKDEHRPLWDGSMDMKLLLRIAMELCPAATYTIELTEAAGSVDWLKMNRLMED